MILIEEKNSNKIDWYKTSLSIVFGLLGFIGSFFSFGVRYEVININFVWSMIFPVCITLAWGKRYGLISIIFGLTFLYPFFLWPYNGWANIVSSVNLFIWVVLLGIGIEQRKLKRKFYYNIYFIQLMYALISGFLFLTLAFQLFSFNSYWFVPALNKESYHFAWVVVIKSVICEFIVLMICEVLLLFVFVKKLFRIHYDDSERFNTRLILCITLISMITKEFLVISGRYFIDGERFSIQRVFQFGPNRLMTLLSEIIIYFIIAGILVHFFQKKLKIESDYQLIWDKMLNGCLIVQPVYDANNQLVNMQVINVNPVVERWFASKAVDIIGKSRSELPDMFDSIKENLKYSETILQTGESVKFEYKFNREFFEINMFNMDKNQIGIMVNNITEQKELERSLRKTLIDLEAIIDSTDDLIWSVDREFRLITINSSLRSHFRKSLKIDLLPGMKFLDLLPDNYGQIWDNLYMRALQEGKYMVDYSATGEEKQYEISLNPICKNGEIIEIACFGRNVSRRKKAETEILKLNAELEQRVIQRTNELLQTIRDLETFTYTVSHDLKAPLRTIEGYCDFIIEDYLETLDQEVIKMVNIIRQNCSDTIRLVDKLLSYAKTSELEISTEPLDLQIMIITEFNETMRNYPDRKIELIIENELPLVMVDKVLFKQIIANILSNALKFTRDRIIGRITVGCTISENEYIFYVKDNGVGFDMEFSGKLFEVFQRLHTTEEYEGTGIGLATIRKIIQKHKGRAWIVGKLNVGAALYFALPKFSID